MANYKLIVFTDPANGREAEYNDWYDNIHIRDVTSVPGIASAQRLKMRTLVAGSFENRYLAIYEFESDDPEAVVAEINQRSGSALMQISDALDSSCHNVAIFETC